MKLFSAILRLMVTQNVSFLFYIIQQWLEYIHESYSYGKLNSREEILRFQFKRSARVYFLFIIILSLLYEKGKPSGLGTRVCMRKPFFYFTKTGKTDGELIYHTEKEFRPLMSSSVRNDKNGRFEEISSK